MKKLVYIAVVLCLACGCHGGPVSNHNNESVSFRDIDDEIDEYGAEAEGLNDPLETSVVVRVGGIGLNVSGHENFLRGYVHKDSLEQTRQLYIQTKERSWMYFDKARFLSKSGLKSFELERVSSDVRCSQYGCAYIEDFIMTPDKQTLDEWRKEDEIMVRLSSSKVSGHIDMEVDGDNVDKFCKTMDIIVSYMKNKPHLPLGTTKK